MTDLAHLAKEAARTYRAAMTTTAHAIRNPNDPTARAAARIAAMANADAKYAYYRAYLEAKATR